MTRKTYHFSSVREGSGGTVVDKRLYSGDTGFRFFRGCPALHGAESEDPSGRVLHPGKDSYRRTLPQRGAKIGSIAGMRKEYSGFFTKAVFQQMYSPWKSPFISEERKHT